MIIADGQKSLKYYFTAADIRCTTYR